MNYRVFVTTPYWHLNGVNSVSASLVRGLRARGVEAEILLTSRAPGKLPAVARPPDVPMRELRHGPGIRARLRALAIDLKAHAPCVYIPGYDYACSGVSAALPDDVLAVGVAHSDDPLHYAHVERLGRWWNAIVCVSSAIERRLKERHPELRDRTQTILNGIEVPAEPVVRSAPGKAPLEIVFASRIEHHQKRVFDLVPLLAELRKAGVAARLTVIGDGIDLAALRQQSAGFASAGTVQFTGPLPNAEVQAWFARSDVFLLTSAFEGMPISLLEAMARGCIPVVTDIPSGIPEIVTHDENGFRLPVGDIGAFTRTLAALAADPARRGTLAAAAARSVRDRGFTTERMAAGYAELFERLFDDVRHGRFHRPPGTMIIPPEFSFMSQLRGRLGHPRQRLRRWLKRLRQPGDRQPPA